MAGMEFAIPAMQGRVVVDRRSGVQMLGPRVGPWVQRQARRRGAASAPVTQSIEIASFGVVRGTLYYGEDNVSGFADFGDSVWLGVRAAAAAALFAL